MRKRFTNLALALGLALAAGCSDKAAQPVGPSNKGKEVAQAAGGHDWWCDEHGVKEEECSMCSPKVAKAFQDKGDWCKEHERAKSQCFICDPSLKEKYAAAYKAKFGKEPPEPVGQKPEKK